MKPERWQQVDHLFQAALDRAPEERAAFVRAACNGDDSLQREVETLLAADGEAGNLFEAPAYQLAAPLIAQDNARSLIAKSIAHYQIISFVGKGGMGEVYRAKDVRLGREVALKLLPADFTADPDRVWRFEREARAASALNHPNILTIYDIGTDGCSRFIAAEFIEGATLRAHLKAEKFSLPATLDVAIQVASALAAAHGAGIIHRDIKPENVMVRLDGYVKVLDFGLAKLTEQQAMPFDSAAATLDKVCTAPGTVMGTLNYMSPEQVRGQEVDVCTDIFSFGVVLYEMLTHQPPFAADSSADVIAAILERQPAPISQYSTGLPDELQRIVSKALQKDRAERYQTVNDLLVDLKSLKEELDFRAKLARSAQPESGEEQPAAASTGEQIVQTQEVGKARTTSSIEYLISGIKQHKRGVALGLTALILIGAGAVFGIYRIISQRQVKPEPKTQPVAPLQTMQMRRLTNSGNIKTAAISPDGKYVAYVVDDSGQQSLWVRQVIAYSNIQIVAAAEAKFHGLTFSLDSNYIYYVYSELNKPLPSLYQVPVLGGSSKQLLTEVSSPVTFSPDGRLMAFMRRDILTIANVDGTGVRELSRHSQHSLDHPVAAYYAPTWSPDGKIIACPDGSRSSNEHYHNLVGVQVEDGHQKPLTAQRWPGLYQAAWVSDGVGLFMTASDKDSKRLQLWHLSYPSGEPHKITNDLVSYGGLSLTSDSNSLVSVQYEQRINLWVLPNADTSRATQIISGAGRDEDIAGISWTSDGRIIYVSQASGHGELWSVQPDGGNKKQLTFDEVNKAWPAVTSDGHYIVYTAVDSGGPSIWRVNIDGMNPKQLSNLRLANFPDCSPDGKWVVFSSSSEGLWKVSIDGGTPVQLSKNKTARRPAISPDGKLMACRYKEQADSPEQLALFPFDGGEPIKVFDVPPTIDEYTRVLWTPDGKGLAYVNKQGNVSNLWVQPLDGSLPKQWTDFKSDQVLKFAWSRDGKQLALSRGTVTSDVVLLSEIK